MCCQALSYLPSLLSTGRNYRILDNFIAKYSCAHTNYREYKVPFSEERERSE